MFHTYVEKSVTVDSEDVSVRLPDAVVDAHTEPGFFGALLGVECKHGERAGSVCGLWRNIAVVVSRPAVGEGARHCFLHLRVDGFSSCAADNDDVVLVPNEVRTVSDGCK